MRCLWRTLRERLVSHGIIRSRRKSENMRRNISSVSTSSWNPKRRALLGIGDDIVIGSEYAVRVAPSRDLFVAEFLQSVLFDDLSQIGPLSAMDRARLMCRGGASSIPKKSGELGPYVLPPDEITVGDVESLVRAFRIGRHPLDGLCQKSGIRTLVERGIRVRACPES